LRVILTVLYIYNSPCVCVRVRVCKFDHYGCQKTYGSEKKTSTNDKNENEAVTLIDGSHNI